MTRNVSSIIHNFGSSTSMHGVPSAIRAKSTLGHLVWGSVCLLAASMFGLQLTQLLRKYFDNPKKVVIDFVPLAVPFPSISLCNMRNLDNVVLNKLNQIFKSQDNITYILQLLEEMEKEEILEEQRKRNGVGSKSVETERDGNLFFNADLNYNLNFNQDFNSMQDASVQSQNEQKEKKDPSKSEIRRIRRQEEQYDKDTYLPYSNNFTNTENNSSYPKFSSNETVYGAYSSWNTHINDNTMDRESHAGNLSQTDNVEVADEHNDISEEQSCDEYMTENANYQKNKPTDIRSILRGVKLTSFIGQYLQTFAKYRPISRRLDVDLHILHTVLGRTTMATNIGREILASAGVPFKEFIVSCRFGGEACNKTRDFRQFFDSYYYNCFTYQAPSAHDENEDSSLAEGLENGWSATVLSGSSMLDQNERIRRIPGTHQFLSPMSSSEGVRVVIHPKDTEPYPHTEGFDVPPGYSASFGVKARKNIRLGSPYGNCSDDNPFQDEAHNYRLISCQKHCLQKAIVKACQCKDILLPGQNLYPDVRYCADDSDIPDHCRQEDVGEECVQGLHTIYNRFMCVRHVTTIVARSNQAIRDCQCYPACSEITYDVSYSLSRWPAESFDGDEVYMDVFDTEEYYKRFQDPDDIEKEEVYSRHFDECNRRQAMRDFARLNVYIADSNVIQTEEQADYSSTQLMADIGGQLGLWVGVSVITLAEVLELFLDLLRYFSLTYGPYSEGKKFNSRRHSVMDSSSSNQNCCAGRRCDGSCARENQSRIVCRSCNAKIIRERTVSLLALPVPLVSTEVEICNGGSGVNKVRRKKQHKRKQCMY